MLSQKHIESILAMGGKMQRQWKLYPNDIDIIKLEPPLNNQKVNSLKYHCDWNWLMPVVEKIESLKDDIVIKMYVSINGNKCELWNYFKISDVLRAESWPKQNHRHSGKTKIEAVYNAVICFIESYNEQKLKLNLVD